MRWCKAIQREDVEKRTSYEPLQYGGGFKAGVSSNDRQCSESDGSESVLICG